MDKPYVWATIAWAFLVCVSWADSGDPYIEPAIDPATCRELCRVANECRADCRFLQEYDSCFDFCLDLLDADRLADCRFAEDCREFNYCFCNSKQVSEATPEACGCTVVEADRGGAWLTALLLAIGGSALVFSLRTKGRK